MFFPGNASSLVAHNRLVAIKREPELHLPRNAKNRKRQLVRFQACDLNRQRASRKLLIDAVVPSFSTAATDNTNGMSVTKRSMRRRNRADQRQRDRGRQHERKRQREQHGTPRRQPPLADNISNQQTKE